MIFMKNWSIAKNLITLCGWLTSCLTSKLCGKKKKEEEKKTDWTICFHTENLFPLKQLKLIQSENTATLIPVWVPVERDSKPFIFFWETIVQMLIMDHHGEKAPLWTVIIVSSGSVSAEAEWCCCLPARRSGVQIQHLCIYVCCSVRLRSELHRWETNDALKKDFPLDYPIRYVCFVCCLMQLMPVATKRIGSKLPNGPQSYTSLTTEAEME